MRVVLIGSGNVASVLGRLIGRKGHELVQVVSRNADHARILANEMGCDFTDSAAQINRSAEFYIMAVSDYALYEISNQYHLDRSLVVHTSGAIPIDILKTVSFNYGVLYPLQSLLKTVETAPDIPILTDGNTPETRTIISDFARTLSGNIAPASDEERLKLHVAAVILNNFTNHLYTLAEEFCRKEKVDFTLLFPLIEETASRMSRHSPSNMQTGPALRNDQMTLDKHLRLLSGYPGLKDLYTKFTKSIISRHS